MSNVRSALRSDPQLLEPKSADDRALCAYLQMLQADPRNEQQHTFQVSAQVLQTSPSCVRAVHTICEIPTLGIKRTLAEQALQLFWPQLYGHLRTLPDLPDECRRIAEAHQRPGAPEAEHRDRRALIQLLQQARDDDSGLPWPVLGRLWHEITFQHALYMVDVRAHWLGLPAGELVTELTPLLEGHLFAAYFQSLGTSDPARTKELVEEQIQALSPTDLDCQAFPLLTKIFDALGPRALDPVRRQVIAHQDLIVGDLLKAIDQDRQLLAIQLSEAAPHMPQVVIAALTINARDAPEKVAAWESKYAHHAGVLSALVTWHMQQRRFDDAARVLNQQIAIAPEHAAYERLAGVYYRQNDLEKWRETLERALQLPSSGLEPARIRMRLAKDLMRHDQPAQALPHALEAAASYSASGLDCAAECYERLGKYAEAEQFVQARAERYSGSAFDWYFWCARTGRGNVDAARAFARKYVSAVERNPPEKQFSLAILHGVEGRPEAALAVCQKCFDANGGSYAGLYGAVLAEALGNAILRDSLLRGVAAGWNREQDTSDLANLFVRYLQDPGQAWNDLEFEILVAKAQEGFPTHAYFLVGKLLEQRDPGRSRQFLQSAATSPHIDQFGALLASVELRRAKIEVEPQRRTELAGRLSELSELVRELQNWRAIDAHEQVLDAANRLLEKQSDLAPALLWRGIAAERLGREAEALADYERLLELHANLQVAQHNLAVLLAATADDSLRDPPRALQHAQRAYELQPTKNYANYSAMAIAHAACGEFDLAIKHQQRAVRYAPETEKVNAEARLALFQQQQPYRRSPRP